MNITGETAANWKNRKGFGGLLRTSAIAALMAAAAACASPEEKVERYTASGQEFLEAGEMGKANVQFRNALKIDERHVPALEGLAEIAEERGKIRAMFGLLQRIARADPTNVPAKTKIAKFYLLAGDAAEALETVDEALAIAPDDPEATAAKAAILYKLENREEAVKLARKALDADPSIQEAVTVLAADLVEQGEIDAALKEIDASLKADQSASVLHLLRIELLSQQGRDEDVDKAHLALIEQFPDEPGFRQAYAQRLVKWGRLDDARAQLVEVTNLRQKQTSAVVDVAQIDYRQGGTDKAAETFREYIAKRPDQTELKFAYAAFLRKVDRNDEASTIYQEMAKLKDDEPSVLHAKNEIASMALVNRDRKTAEALIDEILAVDERNSEALIKKSTLRILDGDTDGAIGDLRLVLADQPEADRAKLLIAAAYEKKGEIEAADAQYAEAMDDSDAKASVAKAYAQFLLRNNNIQRAERVLTQAVAVNNRDEDNLKLLAAIRLQQQDWRGAEEVAELLRESESENAVATRILGVAYAGLEDYAGAIDVLGTENEKKPLASRPLATLVTAYIESGRTAEAESVLRSNIERDPADYDARVLLSRVMLAANRSPEAKEVLREAIDVDAQRFEAYEILYRLYRLEGRAGDAATLLDQGLSRSPENDGLRVLKADLLISNGAFNDALTLYEDVLSRRPNDIIVSNNYAAILTDRTDEPEALARAAQVAQVLKDSPNPSFLDTYGWATYRAGRQVEGIAALEKAVAGAPDLIEAHYHLGVALHQTGKTDRAKLHLSKVVDAGGGVTEAQIEQAKALLAE